jgi:hypothetical protein
MVRKKDIDGALHERLSPVEFGVAIEHHMDGDVARSPQDIWGFFEIIQRIEDDLFKPVGADDTWVDKKPECSTCFPINIKVDVG